MIKITEQKKVILIGDAEVTQEQANKPGYDGAFKYVPDYVLLTKAVIEGEEVFVKVYLTRNDFETISLRKLLNKHNQNIWEELKEMQKDILEGQKAL